MTNGLRVKEGRIYSGEVEIGDVAVARAINVDRRIVRAAVETIESTEELKRVFTALLPTAMLKEVAPLMGWSCIEVIPTDAHVPGIIADVTGVIAEAGISVRQAMVDDPELTDEPRLYVITGSEVPPELISGRVRPVTGLLLCTTTATPSMPMGMRTSGGATVAAGFVSSSLPAPAMCVLAPSVTRPSAARVSPRALPPPPREMRTLGCWRVNSPANSCNASAMLVAPLIWMVTGRGVATAAWLHAAVNSANSAAQSNRPRRKACDRCVDGANRGRRLAASISRHVGR